MRNVFLISAAIVLATGDASFEDASHCPSLMCDDDATSLVQIQHSVKNGVLSGKQEKGTGMCPCKDEPEKLSALSTDALISEDVSVQQLLKNAKKYGLTAQHFEAYFRQRATSSLRQDIINMDNPLDFKDVVKTDTVEPPQATQLTAQKQVKKAKKVTKAKKAQQVKKKPEDEEGDLEKAAEEAGEEGEEAAEKVAKEGEKVAEEGKEAAEGKEGEKTEEGKEGEKAEKKPEGEEAEEGKEEGKEGEEKEGEEKKGEEKEGEEKKGEEKEGEKKGEGEEGKEKEGEEGKKGEGEEGKEGEEKEGEEGEEKEEDSEQLDPEFFKETRDLTDQFIILDPHMAIAVSLLFAISFQMMLVYVIAWPDIKIRFYAWLLISTTISIFVAVLLYQAINTYINETLFPIHNLVRKGISNTIQMLILYFLAQIITSIASGAWRYILHDEGSFLKPGDEVCLDGSAPTMLSAVSSGTEYWDGKTKPLSIARQKDIMKRNTRCWAMLFAHATGFAALNAAGCIQHSLPQDKPLYAYIVPFVSAIFFIIVFSACRHVRLQFHKKAHAGLGKAHSRGHVYHEDCTEEAALKGGGAWSMQLWDEEVYDCEVDISALCVSFLTVQAIRFNCSGHLPDNFGVEEEKDEYMHDIGEFYKLLGCSLLFIATLAICVKLKATMKPSGPLGRVVKRAIGLMLKASSMAFAWCLLYASMYREAKDLSDEAPWTITERMILAFVLSVISFMMIFGLDALSYLPFCAGARGQETIYEVILALAILVGFSWEQCFDRAVEVIASNKRVVGDHKVETQVGLAAVICLIVIVPWRRVILATAMKYEEEAGLGEEESESESESGSGSGSEEEAAEGAGHGGSGGLAHGPEYTGKSYKDSHEHPNPALGPRSLSNPVAIGFIPEAGARPGPKSGPPATSVGGPP